MIKIENLYSLDPGNYFINERYSVYYKVNEEHWVYFSKASIGWLEPQILFTDHLIKFGLYLGMYSTDSFYKYIKEFHETVPVLIKTIEKFIKEKGLEYKSKIKSRTLIITCKERKLC